MPQSNGPAIHINLVDIKAQRADAINIHARESFVDLKEVDVVLRDARLLKCHRNRDTRANTHNPGCEARHSGRNVLCEDPEAQLLGLSACHKQDRGRPVSDLASVAACRLPLTPLREGAWDLAQGFFGCSVADSIVLCENGLGAFTRAWVQFVRLGGNNLGEEVRPLGALSTLERPELRLFMPLSA